MDSVGPAKDIALAGLAKAREENGGWNLYVDGTGNAGTFFSYQNINMMEIGKDKIKIAMGNATIEDVLESYRAAVIRCMRFGSTVCFNLGKLEPDFNAQFTSDNFPAKTIFDREAIMKDENWKKLLRDGENVDRMGGEGNF